MTGTTQSLTNQTAILASYVPCAVVEWLRSGIPLHPGETTQFNAVVIVARFSGLGDLIVRLSRETPGGAAGAAAQEAIDVRINEALGDLVALVHRFGGVVSQIDADALVAYIPQHADIMMTEVARRGLTCALDMQNLMKTRGAAWESDIGRAAGFSIRVGVAYGPLSAIIIGDVVNWQAFVIGGTALDWAVACTQYANRGQVIASANIIAPLRSAVTSEQLTGGHYLVADLATRAGSGPLNALEVENLWPEWLASRLEPFVAPEVARHIAAGGGGPLPVFDRDVVCMSVKFEGPGYDDVDAGQQLMDYVRQVNAIVRRDGGYIDRVYAGNLYGGQSAGRAGRKSLLRAIFDMPGGPETSRWQAVACALALQRSAFAPAYDQGIGLASGAVLICTLGATYRRQYAAVGDVIYTADELAGSAAPGEVWVDGAVQAQTSRTFAFDRPDSESTIYRLGGEQSTAGNLAAHYPLNRPPVVGRAAELAVLERAVTEVWQGRGQVVVLTGAAGIGKSRLVEALAMRWLEGVGRGYAANVPPHGSAVPFLPWIEIWRAICGLSAADDSIIARDKLTARVRGVCEHCDHAAALFGSLLNIAIPEPETLAPLDAQARHTRLFDLCTEFITGIAAQEYPLLLIFENLQWVDASTRALLARLAPAIAGCPVLLCLTQRPAAELVPGVCDLPHATHIDLAPLTGAENWALAEQTAGAVDWPPPVRARLEALFGRPGDATPHASPLFVEEAVGYLREQNLLAAFDSFSRRALDALPADLDDLLAARLARLDAPLREALQAASVIGLAFSPPLLAAVDPGLLPSGAPDELLNALVAGGFLSNVVSEIEWRVNRFQHPLIAEVAYRQMPGEQRRRRHANLAEYLAVTPIASDAQHIPRIYALAHHYDAGAMSYPAAHYAMEAAAYAHRHGAFAEALHYYAIVERNAARLPYDGERWPLDIEVNLSRGRIYLAWGEHAHAESASRNALHQATSHRDRRRQAQAFNLRAALCLAQGSGEEAVQLAEDAVRIAEASGFELELVEAWRLKGLAYLDLGHRVEAVPPLRRALDLARVVADPVLVAQTTAAMGVVYMANYLMIDALTVLTEALALIRPSGDKKHLAEHLAHLGWVYFQRGEGRLALAAYHEAAGILRAIDPDGKGLGRVLTSTASALCFEGKYTQARACLDEATALFERRGDSSGVAKCLVVRGRDLERDLGEYQAALDALRAAADVLIGADDVDAALEALLALADIQVQMGQLDEAAEHVRLVRTFIEFERARWFWPEYHLVSGRLALERGDYQAVCDHASEALSSISGRGDPRILPGIYMLLAQALQAADPDQRGAIYDALKRSLLAARGRARRLDNALAARALGRYLVSQPKNVNKALGAGYLFEAEELLRKMGLPAPG
ncbi:MAG: AAA family ATPase [Anaerolineae bacterium]|nr:AAA family ATPase [Anaerolineae bacterium]